MEETLATESVPAPATKEEGEAARAPAVALEPATTTISNNGATRENVVEVSPNEERPPPPHIFQRLGRRRSPPRRRRSPDRFPDLSECPTRGAIFGGLRPVPRDGRDPSCGACFNCRQGGHTRFNCREPPSLFCYNCGRWGTTLTVCPRCGEAHLEYLREQGRATLHDVRSRSSGRSSKPRNDRRDPPTPPPTPPARHRRLDEREPASRPDTAPPPGNTSVETPPPTPPTRHRRLIEREHPAGLGTAPPPVRANVEPPPPSKENTQAGPSTPRMGLTDYFETIRDLPGDLQETLLRAYLSRE